MTNSVMISAWKDRIKEIEYNPSSMARIALETLKEINNGEIEIVDTATPFVYSLLSSAVNTSAAIDEARALNRRQYPIEAVTEDDLYMHMSDRDYINRFAVPSKASFKIAFEKSELLSKLVYDPNLEISKLVIPRGTKVTVNNIVFTLLYPIEIRQLQHGGIQILYNTNIISPIQTLDTNIIDYEIYKDTQYEWLAFDIELLQVSVTTNYGSVDLIKSPEINLVLSGYYYYLRVFIEKNGDWVEVKTTHTEQVYDITELTAVIKVTAGNVNVSIPQIYMNTGKLTGRLRYDLYQTQADINADLSVYPIGIFKTEFTDDLFDVGSSTYSAPLKTFKTVSVFSQDITTGGALPMTFEELRNAVINNSVGQQEIPITPIQAQTALERAGYDIVTNVDNITGRSMLATRRLPLPDNQKLVTPASSSVEPVLLTEKEAKALNSVKVNFRSVTITPDTIFQNRSGVMKMVSKAKVDALLTLTPELIANDVSTNRYFYTPFHYVLHFDAENFSAKPYYLDSPAILLKTFVSDNDKTLMQVSINEYEIHRTETGYQILISVKSDESYRKLNDKDVFVQLAYRPTKEKDYAYINGTLVAVNNENERVFSFDLSTNFYIDKADELYLTKFKMYSDEEKSLPTPLLNDFDVLFATSADMSANWAPDDIDKKLGKFLLPKTIYGIANEKIRVKLGVSLENLWARSRSIITAADYLLYSDDVPMKFEEDVYDIDPVTGSAVKIINGQVVHQILHKKGDPVTDDKGNPVMAHLKGDVVLDKKGKPAFADEYSLTRQIDLLLVEGEYWFATDEVTQSYKQELVGTFVDWIIDGLGEISKHLLEQTKVYFYPKSTVGEIDAMVNNSTRTYLASGQTFNVVLYVSKIVHDNLELRKKLSAATVTVISEQLDNETVNKSNIISALKDAYGSDVIGFDLFGLGGGNTIDSITVLNEAKRCSIRKRLVAQGDGSLIVEEDVTCDFQIHDKKQLD